MQILIVTDSFYPDGFGGKHSYVYYLAKGLVERGNSVFLVTINPNGELSDEENIDGIYVFRYNAPTRGGMLFLRCPFWTFVNTISLFRKISKKYSFDVFSFHTVLPAFSILCSKIIKTAKIFTFHASMFQEVVIQSRKKRYAWVLNPILFGIIKIIEKITLLCSDRIIVLSKFNEEQLFNLYRIPAAKKEIIPGGVDLNKFKMGDASVARERLRLPLDKNIIITVRRLVPRMGIDILIDAFSKIFLKNENILLLVAGDGYLKKEIEQKIKNMHLEEGVRLLGFVRLDELIEYYQASDFFVLPTQELEGFGMVTLEALSCGIPVLGTPVGGTVEILKKFNPNMLFKGRDIIDITDGIKQFLSIKPQWPLIRSQCREFALRNYSWDKICLDNEVLFKKEVKNKEFN